MNLIERGIQNALYPWLHLNRKHSPIVPSFTPVDWFECDMMSVTKKGYMQEFEIKLSRSDFKADAKKGPNEWTRAHYGRMSAEERAATGVDLRTKHARLAARDHRGPSMFWFVTPPDLLTEEDIPEWAGWIEMVPTTYFDQLPEYLIPRIKKQAPKLHQRKINPAVLEYAKSVFYHRFWRLRQGLSEDDLKLTNDLHGEDTTTTGGS